MSEHTPGPWILQTGEGHNDRPGIFGPHPTIPTGSRGVFHSTEQFCASWKVSDADRALLEASPAMLAAMKAVSVLLPIEEENRNAGFDREANAYEAATGNVHPGRDLPPDIVRDVASHRAWKASLAAGVFAAIAKAEGREVRK